MKKSILVALFGIGLILGASRAEAQHFYVSIAPAPTVVVRGNPPSPRHVWVPAEWAWSGGRYVETPAHWALPPRGHAAWTAGHWVDGGHRGKYWVAGHWR